MLHVIWSRASWRWRASWRALSLDVMNAAGWREAGLTGAELESLLQLDRPSWEHLGPRELVAARYAEALSRTPVQLDEQLISALRAAFGEREIVVLALTVAQVNFWSRFNQGLGISAAGFFDESACALPRRQA